MRIKCQSFLVPIHHSDYDRLKKDTIFFEEEEPPYPKSYIQERINSSTDQLYHGNVLGFSKIIPPSTRANLGELVTKNHGTLRYSEDQYVSIRSRQIEDINFRHPFKTPNYPPGNVNIAMVTYSILLLFCFCWFDWFSNY